MSKLNILLNGTNYSIDESVLSEAKASLKSHLSSTMSGEGATINLDGVSYNIDSTKLSSARNDLITHLGTMAGTGPKITINGVEYSVDSTKINNILTEMHNAFSNLIGELPHFTYGQEVKDSGCIYVYKGMTTLEEARNAFKLLIEAETGLSWEDFLAEEGIDEEDIWEEMGIIEETFVPQAPQWAVRQDEENSAPNIYVVEEVEDIPVTNIDDLAFAYNTNIVKATIGNNITSIGISAFESCDNLTSVTIGEGVKDISRLAFGSCNNLKEIYFNATDMNDLEYGNEVFRWAGRDGGGVKVVIGKNVKKIPGWLFHPTNLGNEAPPIVSFEFEEGSVCESIGERLFVSPPLSSITLPRSLTNIDSYALSSCHNLTSINFEGTMAQWSAINKGEDWYTEYKVTYVQCSDGQVTL